MSDPRDVAIARLFASPWNRHYAAAKLCTDPLYQKLLDALRESQLPLLDVGCGIGLSAFYLRSHGFSQPIHGLDYDAGKIGAAHNAIIRSGFGNLIFRHHDAREGLPEHLGNVCILDILQFFNASDQEKLLHEAASRVAPGGMLLIRSGIRDGSTRFRITVAGDLLARLTFWMRAAPTHYPTLEDFQRILSPHGTVQTSPLWGRTPFNNHWITMLRPR